LARIFNNSLWLDSIVKPIPVSLCERKYESPPGELFLNLCLIFAGRSIIAVVRLSWTWR